jgi:hypothetical protein
MEVLVLSWVLQMLGWVDCESIRTWKLFKQERPACLHFLS